MGKKLLVGSTMALSALGFYFCAVNVNAVSSDIVTNDEFVFNANNLESGYNSGSTIASSNGVNVKLGNNYQGNVLNAGFDFGDYNFKYCLLAKTPSYSIRELIINNLFSQKSKNQDLAQYYISAAEGTRCGVYYTVVDKTPVNNTYYVSNNNTVSIIKENSKKKYTTVDTFTEQLDSMYYSEFTFGSQGTVGLMSDTQYICLFGVSIVTEEEIGNREESNQAIDALIEYYNTYGLSTSEEFSNLIEAVNVALNDVNHYSKVDNYETFKEISNKFNELVNVESKINVLKNNDNNRLAKALAASINVKYDDNTKALLDELALEIEEAKALGISEEEISNYYLYVNALNEYNEMSNAAIEAFVNKVDEAYAVIGQTSSYALINEAEELYNALNSYDKENETVIAAYNALQEIKKAYLEYEAKVTNNDVEYNYNEDGTVKNIIFIGTINDFTSVSDLSKITMYITNESTNETEEYDITSVCTALKLRGEYVKTASEGVRYIYTKISNEDGQYNGIKFLMTYSVEFNDGHVITSKPISIVVGE